MVGIIANVNLFGWALRDHVGKEKGRERARAKDTERKRERQRESE